MNYIDVINKRKSVRTYKKSAISKEQLMIIGDIIKDNDNLQAPFKNRFKFELIGSPQEDIDKKIKIGSYGFIKDPYAYITAVCRNDRSSLVDFGYSLEKIVLDLTAIGIGTCWLGGIKRKGINEKLKTGKDQVIPCVVSIGYEDKRRTSEKLIRNFAKADTRLPWDELFFKNTFADPISQEYEGIFKVSLEMLRKAPSASNKQPWRVIISENESSCCFYLEKTPGYVGNKLGFEMQSIDIGIALSHFKLTCLELGVEGHFCYDEKCSEKAEGNKEYITSFERGIENGN